MHSHFVVFPSTVTSGVASILNNAASQYSVSLPLVISVLPSYVFCWHTLHDFSHDENESVMRIKLAAKINFLFIVFVLKNKYKKSHVETLHATSLLLQIHKYI